MQVSEVFLKAKKAKNLNAIVIAKRDDNSIKQREYFYLCITEENKYTGKDEHIFVDTDTTINIRNYSAQGSKPEKQIKQIVFHLSVYGDNYVRTFLNSIKKDSNVSFKVIAWNGCDAWEKVKFVSHSLIGIIDGKEYLLDTYVGENNTASPVKEY